MDYLTVALILIGLGAFLLLGEMFTPSGGILVVAALLCFAVAVGTILYYGTELEAVVAIIGLAVGVPGGRVSYASWRGGECRSTPKLAEPDGTALAPTSELELLKRPHRKDRFANATLRKCGIRWPRLDAMTEGMMLDAGVWVRCVDVEAWPSDRSRTGNAGRCGRHRPFRTDHPESKAETPASEQSKKDEPKKTISMTSILVWITPEEEWTWTLASGIGRTRTGGADLVGGSFGRCCRLYLPGHAADSTRFRPSVSNQLRIPARAAANQNIRKDRHRDAFDRTFPLSPQTLISPTSIVAIVVALVSVLIFIVFLFIFFSFIRLWIQALLTKADIGLGSLVGMKLRNVDYAMIVRQKIALVQAGVRINDRRTGIALPGTRQRTEDRNRGDRGAQGRPGLALAHRGGNRPRRARTYSKRFAPA